jgi:hypothetical protein
VPTKRKPAQSGPSLFDVIETEERRDRLAQGEECQHPKETFGETYWGVPRCWRLTATCVDCGRIRGRGGRDG